MVQENTVAGTFEKDRGRFTTWVGMVYGVAVYREGKGRVC